MEQFKKKLQLKLFLSLGALIISIIIIIAHLGLYWHPYANITIVHYDNPYCSYNWYPNENVIFITQVCLFTALIAISGLNIIRYIRCLCNTERLNNLYVKKTDERSNYISNKTATLTLNITIGALGFATIVAGYTDPIIFITLLCALIFLVVIHGISSFYYHMKH